VKGKYIILQDVGFINPDICNVINSCILSALTEFSNLTSCALVKRIKFKSMEYHPMNEMYLNQAIQSQRILFTDKNFVKLKSIDEKKEATGSDKKNRLKVDSAVKLNSKMKLSESARLLSNRMLNVSEVAYSLEFKDPKYFSKCFKKEFGMTPREYRDSLINKSNAEEGFGIDEKFVSELTTKIIDNLSLQHFSVDQLAEKLNISYSNLYRKVKANIGVTPGDFIRKIRIQHAKNLMDLNDFSISDIAFNTGFCNTSYFSRCFKSELGLFPTEYRILKNIG
jgi:Transcriptional regulator containing an amidase domain and an AraC-type DNA-binding HTH domain